MNSVLTSSLLLSVQKLTLLFLRKKVGFALTSNNSPQL